jgi:glutamine synthetase
MHGFGNLFAGNGSKPGMLSTMAIHYIGGILKHARALAAFTNPTTNSYKRLVPGYEAPTTLAYSCRNRSASIRIPAANGCKGRRIEVRFPDASCNPYLAFSAMLMAGLDGIANKIDPGETLDKDIYEMSGQELADVAQLPGTLSEALDCLEEDHEFLMKHNVFTKDLIDTWVDYKRKNEVDDLRKRPHPREFHLYFDV